MINSITKLYLFVSKLTYLSDNCNKLRQDYILIVLSHKLSLKIIKYFCYHGFSLMHLMNDYSTNRIFSEVLLFSLIIFIMRLPMFKTLFLVFM